MQDPDSRFLLITGVSRGLGAAYMAHAEAAGCRLLGIVRPGTVYGLKPGETRAVDSQKIFAAIDLSEPHAGDKLESVLDREGIVVGEALHAAGGGLGLRNPLLGSDDLNRLLQVNLLSAVDINRAVIPRMQALGRGRIVHIGSTASTEAVGSVGYNTAKSALNAYVRSLGRELVADGISVSGINPGAFTAPENAMVRLEKRQPGAIEDFTKRRIPRGFMGTAEEFFPLLDLLLFGDSTIWAGSMVAADAGESRSYAE